MENLHFSVPEDDYIELIKLLKNMNLVGSGGEAKFVVDSGSVRVNSEVESRKRRKLRIGDYVEFEDIRIDIQAE